MMLDLARSIDVYRRLGIAGGASSNVSADKYYGKGYQDVQNRVPWIDNTTEELGWTATGRHATAAAPHLRLLPRPSRRCPRAGGCRLIPDEMSGTSPANGARDERIRRLALKIDVDTLRGTLEGVPHLTALLQQLRARATFYFCSDLTTPGGRCDAYFGAVSSARSGALRCWNTTAGKRCCMARCCRARISAGTRLRDACSARCGVRGRPALL